MQDLQQIFADLNSRLAPIHETLSRLSTLGAELSESSGLILPESFKKPLFDPAELHQLEKSLKYMILCTEAIGKGGWTLPLWMEYDDVGNLYRRTDATPKKMDQFFLTMYEDDDGKKELDAIFDRLQHSDELNLWNPLICECIDTFNLGRHRVCVPALLTILEGAFLDELGLLDSRTMPNKAVEKVERNPTYIFTYPFDANMYAFISEVFGENDFSGPEPIVISRHRILHGRGSTEWSKADAIRLFQALEIFAF